MHRFLFITLFFLITSCAELFLRNPVPEDFQVSKRFYLSKTLNLIKPKYNGIYWFLTGDTLSRFSRELDSLNYGKIYSYPALYSSGFVFKDSVRFDYKIPGLASTPYEYYNRFIKRGLSFSFDNYSGYYIISDSIEMEYLYVETQLVKKFYYEFRASLSSNADTLFIHYLKSRNGKYIEVWNKIAVFYPFPDSVKLK